MPSPLVRSHGSVLIKPGWRFWRIDSFLLLGDWLSDLFVDLRLNDTVLGRLFV